MRVARIRQPNGRTRFVDVDVENLTARPLRPAVPEIEEESGLDALLAFGPPEDVLTYEDAPAVDLVGDAVVWLSPIEDPHTIICAGQNFAVHAQESAVVATPTRPSAFFRVSRTLAGHRSRLSYPAITSALDYEVEVAAIISTDAYDIEPRDALRHVAGFCLANDISARDIQFEEARAGSMVLGKNVPGSLPLGPWLTTMSEVGELGEIEISLTVNGNLKQSDVLASMVYSFPELISYWSILGLRAGDVVLSGTPAGVAIFRHPPEDHLLKPGDVVLCRSPQLGELQTTIGPPVERATQVMAGGHAGLVELEQTSDIKGPSPARDLGPIVQSD